ncbi:MAG: sterol desaturase family protein [Caulobacterales bacterium]
MELASASTGAARTPARAAVIVSLLFYVALLGVGWWSLTTWIPDHLAFTAFGRHVVLGEIHRRIVNNGLVLFLILPSTLWLECAIVGWNRSSARQLLFAQTPSARSDLACLFAGQAHLLDIAGRFLTLGAAIVSGLLIHGWLKSSFGVVLSLAPLPLALQVVAYFFVYTFFDYWTHRLDHTRYFWPLHRYHHSAREFYVVTAVRVHPATFTGTFLINLPMAVLGASPAVLIYVNTLVIAIGFLIHSRIDSDWGWIGRYVVQSPTHHRLHHVLDTTEPTGHFSIAPVWDHLFGTWRGDADQSLPIGVDTPYRHGLWLVPDLLRDYWDFWKGIFRRRP